MTAAQMTSIDGSTAAAARWSRTRQAATIRSLTKSWPSPTRTYVAAHCTCFFLYAALGRGFAYVGVAPLYVGEVLLVAAIVTTLRSQKLYQLIQSPIGISLILFILWQAVRTAPYVTAYGILSIRDAMIWIYSLYGIVIASLILILPNSTEYVIRKFKLFGKWYPFCGFISVALCLYFIDFLPMVPGTGIPVVNVRCGEFCVQVAGITAFAMAGYFRTPSWWFIPIGLGVLLAGSSNRGGLLAFLASVCVITILRRQFKLFCLLSLTLIVVSFSVLIATSGDSLRSSGSRQFSPMQIVDNLASIGNDDADPGLQGTKAWRLNWWSKILDYTVYGDHFWTGKGYGINLAIDDGIIASSSTDSAPLRSPHNSHLNFLARSGVPGAALWTFLQLSWLLTMLSRFRRAQRLQDKRSEALFSWLIAYWAAFLVNSSFDVALEGPMSAIPFWTIFGLGWGAALLTSNQTKGRHGHLIRAVTRSMFQSNAGRLSREEFVESRTPFA